ncbi:MAG: SDR family NAD(P)-dependent oxidoreductase [Desulfobacterales bacterium]|nr:SDR family NAD(P)-dependent oxidoreductase [Desulfobacterales bacterium]
MIRIAETITGRCRPHAVFNYLANFANIQAWDPTVLAARALSAGPSCRGMRFDLKMQFGLRCIPMSYHLVEMDPPRRLVFFGRGVSFRSLDVIDIEPAPTGFRLNYKVGIAFDPAAGSRLLEHLAAPVARINARRAMRRLETILGGDDGRLPKLTPLGGLADRLLLPGLMGFTRLGYLLGRRRWPLAPRPLAGQRVVLTGGTSGIGLAAARQLLALGADLTLVGRNPDKTAAVARRLRTLAPAADVDFEIADLSLLAAVHALARRLRQRHATIHILVNNAGALFNPRAETPEGLERTLATDLLSPYLLTRLLLPVLAATPGARVINVSSGGMYTQKIHPADLNYTRGAYDGATAYARAKRGLVILSEILAGELKARGIRVQAMHPGWVDTPGLQSSLPGFYRLVRPLLRTPPQGADTITWLAASPVAGRTSGLFWLDRKPRTTHVLPGTRESAAERQLFLKAIDKLVQPYL